MKRLFEDFIDNVDSQDIVKQSETEKRTTNWDTYETWFSIEIRNVSYEAELDIKLQRLARKIEAVLNMCKDVTRHSAVTFYTSNEKYIEAGSPLIEIYKAKINPSNIFDVTFFDNLVNHSLCIRFAADTRFRSVETFLRFAAVIQKYSVRLPGQDSIYPLYFAVKQLDGRRMHGNVADAPAFFKIINDNKLKHSSKEYIYLVCRNLQSLQYIIKKPFEKILDEYYTLADYNPEYMMLNAAINNWLKAYHHNQKKPVKLTNEFKEYVTSHPVKIDVEGIPVTTFDYSLIYLDNPNIVDKRGFLRDSYGMIQKMLKQGMMIPRDVMIKTFDENICYTCCLIFEPYDYEGNGRYKQLCVLWHGDIRYDKNPDEFCFTYGKKTGDDDELDAVVDETVMQLFENANS